MAFWGAPLEDQDHSLHAIQAALSMKQNIVDLNQDFANRGWPQIRIGIGLSSGPVSVGNMGSEFRMAYTVLGDAVNLSSRLESITKQYGVTLLVSESTMAQAPGWIYQEVDLVKVVGKEIPITIYRPLCREYEITKKQQKEMYLFALAIKLYQSQQWIDAGKIIELLISVDSSMLLYQMYFDRIKENKKNPPAKDWDGVFEAKSK